MTGRFVLNVLGLMLALLPAWVLVRWLYLRRHPRSSWLREGCLALFALVLAALATQAFAPGPGVSLAALPALLRARFTEGAMVNLVPLRTILSYGAHNLDGFFVNNVGNVAVFLPLGAGLPLLWQRWQSFPKVALWGLCVSLTIEVSQIFLWRHVDVDDLLLNLLGAMAGYALWAVLVRIVPALRQLAAPRGKAPAA